jgi:hypothetical protein
VGRGFACQPRWSYPASETGRRRNPRTPLLGLSGKISVVADNYRNALQAGHTRLYHYERFCPEWLISTLREHRIHCSNPARLNDPWDCKPTYDPASLQDPREIEEFILWLRTVAKERPEPRIEAMFEERIRTNAEYRNQIVAGLSVSNHEVLERWRIYCLTPKPASTLMWSHYGDGHRGICLEFHVGNPVFLNAWEVKYSAVYPNWVPHRALEYAMAMIFTKSDEWSYEEEFRILASPDLPEGHPMKPDGNFLRLPPKSLTGIVVGCKCDYSEVIEIVRQYEPTLPVKRIIQVPNHYRLAIEGRAHTATV